jgi:hypothetical protein
MLWAMIGQALDPDPSCAKALARLQAHRSRLGLAAVSDDTGAYCKARQRLPEGFLASLFRRSGGALAAQLRPQDLWHGRRVKVVDGSSSSMPDTPANQKEYPQPSGQKPGCGFPVVAYVALFCLATGAALQLSSGPYFVQDLTLFYFLRQALAWGDILLADRAFCSYAEIALLQQRGADTLMRLHQRRHPDFRRGFLLGWRDHLVTWTKPRSCPPGLRREDYERLPDALTLRELQYHVAVPGFRTATVTLVTTLLDPDRYPARDLADLYFRRWDVELDFRHLKITLQMDVLRAKTPDVVRKELWTHLLAYNLLRSVMWAASLQHRVPASRLSLKGALQHLAVRQDQGPAPGATFHAPPFRDLLDRVARTVVPYRPYRFEPRVRKRRPKNYRLMTRPRSELKAALVC